MPEAVDGVLAWNKGADTLAFILWKVAKHVDVAWVLALGETSPSWAHESDD